MHARRAIIVPLDYQERFEDLDVDVFRGNAKFISPHEVKVNGQVLKEKNLVVTSGSSAKIPLNPDLNETPYYTKKTIFDELNDKPESMIIIGGGPISCELGQAMNRLGLKFISWSLLPKFLYAKTQKLVPMLVNIWKLSHIIAGKQVSLDEIEHNNLRPLFR